MNGTRSSQDLGTNALRTARDKGTRARGNDQPSSQGNRDLLGLQTLLDVAKPARLSGVRASLGEKIGVSLRLEEKAPAAPAGGEKAPTTPAGGEKAPAAPVIQQTDEARLAQNRATSIRGVT
ncbi:MAG: hypothetical protein WCP97_03680 [bacterium]